MPDGFSHHPDQRAVSIGKTQMSDYDRHRDHDLYGRRRDFDDYRQETAGRSGEGRSWRGQTDYDFEPQQVGARGYGPQSYGRGPDRSDYRAQSRSDFGRQNDRGGRNDWDFERHGYAPGAEIWGGSDRNSGSGYRAQAHDFEPDYLHWREQQMTAFDNDYRTWRDERRTRFTNDFDTWRKSRSDNVKAEAANPYVGDVAEGGVGRVTKADDRNKQ